MDNLEPELRQSLRRVEPRPAFADRVLARLDPPPRAAAVPHRPFRAASRWAVAAGLAVAIAGGSAYHQRRERARAEAARDQLVLALQITGKQLEQLRRQVNSQESR